MMKTIYRPATKPSEKKACWEYFSFPPFAKIVAKPVDEKEDAEPAAQQYARLFLPYSSAAMSGRYKELEQEGLEMHAQARALQGYLAPQLAAKTNGELHWKDTYYLESCMASRRGFFSRFLYNQKMDLTEANKWKTLVSHWRKIAASDPQTGFSKRVDYDDYKEVYALAKQSTEVRCKADVLLAPDYYQKPHTTASHQSVMAGLVRDILQGPYYNVRLLAIFLETPAWWRKLDNFLLAPQGRGLTISIFDMLFGAHNRMLQRLKKELAFAFESEEEIEELLLDLWGWLSRCPCTHYLEVYYCLVAMRNLDASWYVSEWPFFCNAILTRIACSAPPRAEGEAIGETIGEKAGGAESWSVGAFLVFSTPNILEFLLTLNQVERDTIAYRSDYISPAV